MMESSTTSKINVTSQHFIDHIDTIMIQLTRALAVEHKIRPFPDASQMARAAIINKANNVLTEEDSKFIDEYIRELKNRLGNNQEFDRKSYRILQISGLL